NGCEENSEEGHTKHAAENGGAQGAAHFRARAFGEHQRDDTEYEGKGGHQDGPQAQAAGLDSRIKTAQTGILALFRKLHDKNSILAGEADQNDKTDLGENVVVQGRRPEAAEPNAADGAEEAHRNNQDDGQGQGPAFVLGGEGQENKQNAERKD